MALAREPGIPARARGLTDILCRAGEKDGLVSMALVHLDHDRTGPRGTGALERSEGPHLVGAGVGNLDQLPAAAARVRDPHGSFFLAARQQGMSFFAALLAAALALFMPLPHQIPFRWSFRMRVFTALALVTAAVVLLVMTHSL